MPDGNLKDLIPTTVGKKQRMLANIRALPLYAKIILPLSLILGVASIANAIWRLAHTPLKEILHFAHQMPFMMFDLLLPGISQSFFLLTLGLQPGQLAVLEAIPVALLCWNLPRLANGSAMRLRLGMALRVVTATWALFVVVLQMGPRPHTIGYSDAGFSIEEFEREHDGKTQKLAFIGVQHVADYEFYHHLNAVIGYLTVRNYKVFYEDTDSDLARPNFVENGDPSRYGMPWVRFAQDLMFQPEFWPSRRVRDWVRADLGYQAPEITALKDITDYDEWNRKRHQARECHLLKAINKFSGENLAIIYGAQHLVNMSAQLVSDGWKSTQSGVYPEGRTLRAKPIDEAVAAAKQCSASLQGS